MDSGCLFFFESGGRRRYGSFEILLEGDEGRLVIQHGSANSLEKAGGYGWEPYLHRWRGKARSRSNGSRSPRSGTTPLSTW